MRCLALLALAACGGAPAPARDAWLKGALHVHTGNSGDSHTPPERVADWYAHHGFDFIVLTDHNHVSSLPARADILVAPGVEITQNLETCDPPPTDELGCLLHVNALFVTGTRADFPTATARLDIYANAIAAAGSVGGIAQLNHPNFHWGADAALLTALAHRGLRLFEVANESSDVANEGDATHPSTEALWDAVLTAGETLYGTATDDAHQYDEIGPDIGDRGWVMVHAPREPGAIRDALIRGDFYSSTGVAVRTITTRDNTLAITTAIPVDITFIGEGGRILSRAHSTSASYTITSGYVRAVLVDAAGHHAWIQPLRYHSPR